MQVYLLPLLLTGLSQGALISPDPDFDTAAIPDCQDDLIKSCLVVSIDLSALESEDLELPGGVTMTFEDNPEEDSVTFTGEGGAEATFSHSNGRVYGEIGLPDGSMFVLEPCFHVFPGCHVLMKQDLDVMDKMEENEAALWAGMNDSPDAGERSMTVEQRAFHNVLLKQGLEDSTTLVTYSLKVYYTIEFGEKTEDIPLFVEQMVSEINQGYINSEIPVRVKLHCIEAANVNEVKDGSDMLDNFRNLKSSVAETRQTADSALLLVVKSNVCGIAWVRSWAYGLPLSLVAKGCALGGFTPGHEIGHNFGNLHDKYNSKPSKQYPYGLGKHIGFKNSQGYRTIMAYSTGPEGVKYYRKVNYYSNPDLKWEGMPIGTAEEDSARVITETRFVFAAQGDESDQSCATPAPTATPSLPQTTTGGVETTTGGYETTTGGYETTTGFVGCVMEPEVFLLVNRKDNLGDATRRAQRFITANNATGEVTVALALGTLEQQWQWLRCADYSGSSSSYLVNKGSGAELNGHNGTTVTMSRYPNFGSAWDYSPDVGLLKDSQTGNVASMIKKSTTVKMTSRIRYTKINGVETTSPWNNFLWDLVPVTETTTGVYETTTGGYETTNGGYETTTGGYETTTGFVGCVMEPEVFLLVNRKNNLGDATRRAQRFITASNATGEVTVDKDYRDALATSSNLEQQWQWLRCADYVNIGSNSSYLVNKGSGAELNGHNGTTLTMSRYPEIGSVWDYSPDVGLLKDSQTGKVATVVKKRTTVKMTSWIRYMKDANGVKTTTPWDLFLWDLVPVTEV